jgi:hypothetical protein
VAFQPYRDSFGTLCREDHIAIAPLWSGPLMEYQERKLPYLGDGAVPYGAIIEALKTAR